MSYIAELDLHTQIIDHKSSEKKLCWEPVASLLVSPGPAPLLSQPSLQTDSSLPLPEVYINVGLVMKNEFSTNLFQH